MKSIRNPGSSRISQLIATAAVASALWPWVSAETLTVMNGNDTGPGSLRQAILDANSNETIDFDPGLSGGVIVLQSGKLMVDKNLTVDGSALPEPPAIDGNANDRVLQIASGRDVLLDSSCFGSQKAKPWLRARDYA